MTGKKIRRQEDRQIMSDLGGSFRWENATLYYDGSPLKLSTEVGRKAGFGGKILRVGSKVRKVGKVRKV
jgi:hypothetical protein